MSPQASFKMTLNAWKLSNSSFSAIIGKLSFTKLSLLQASAMKIDMYSVFTLSASDTILTLEISFLKSPTIADTSTGFTQFLFQMLRAARQALELLLVSVSCSRLKPSL